MKRFLIIIICLVTHSFSYSQNEKSDSLNGLEETSLESNYIGIIASLTEGVGIGYRQWSNKSFGIGFSFTPYYLDQRLSFSAGASFLFRLSKKKESFPYLNIGCSFIPKALNSETFAFGIGLGYELNLSEIVGLNFKLDFTNHLLIIPLPGFGVLFKL